MPCVPSLPCASGADGAAGSDPSLLAGLASHTILPASVLLPGSLLSYQFGDSHASLCCCDGSYPSFAGSDVINRSASCLASHLNPRT